MEPINLSLNEKINVLYLGEECDTCNKKLKRIEVNMFYEGAVSSKWQKEKILYCSNCKKYFISIFKQDEFEYKYPGYMYVESDKENINRLSELKCYILSKKAKHIVCNGIPKNKPFIYEKVILENGNGRHTRVSLKKCDICNRYFATQEEAIKLKENVKKLTMIPAKEVESKVSRVYKRPNVNGIPAELDINSKLNITNNDKCNTLNHEITKMSFTVGFRVNKTTRIMKNMIGYYCKNCGMYFVSKEEYDSKAYDKKPECKLYIEGNYKPYIENKESRSIIQQKIKTNNTMEIAEFFVRTNVINCIRDGHKIDDIQAEIDVINKFGEVSKKSINAYYCESCNLYFIYNKDYELLRKNYIPLCSIYEYNKWIEGYNNGISFNQESLLHSFGYNVGAKEDLSEKQRRKILLFIIENGLINKHEIISLLNLFIDMRRNNPSQMNAIKKWQSDISFLKEININIKKEVRINSIKIVRVQATKR